MMIQIPKPAIIQSCPLNDIPERFGKKTSESIGFFLCCDLSAQIDVSICFASKLLVSYDLKWLLFSSFNVYLKEHVL